MMQYCLCCAAMIVHHLAICLMCNNWQVVVSGLSWLDINSMTIVMLLLPLHLVALSYWAASDRPPLSISQLWCRFAPMLSSLWHAGQHLTGPPCPYNAALPCSGFPLALGNLPDPLAWSLVYRNPPHASQYLRHTYVYIPWVRPPSCPYYSYSGLTYLSAYTRHRTEVY